MIRTEIDYSELSIRSDRDAGIDGFSVLHPKLGRIAKIYLNDIRLLNTLDRALEQEYTLKPTEK